MLDSPENLEMQQSGSERLHELEETGDYLFHGSDRRITRLEPRQPMTFDEKVSYSVPDGKPAVCTTPFADIGIFRSLISAHRAKEKGISHFSSFNVEDGKPKFSVTQESLDLAREPGVLGYVHVFSKKGFEKRNEMEWRSKTAVEPIEVIQVNSNDLPESIQIVDSPK